MSRKIYYLASGALCLVISFLGTSYLITLEPTTPQEVKDKAIALVIGIALTIATTVWFVNAMNRFLQELLGERTKNDSAS